MYKSYLLVFAFIIASVSTSIAQNTACPQDTIKYIYAKATNFDTLEIDPTTTSALYQYFETPQEIAIKGVRFYGYKTDTAGGNSMWVTVEIRNANQDSIPGNNLFASDSFLLTTPDSLTGAFSTYANVIIFPLAVNINEDYTVVVKTNSSNPNFSLFHTNLTPTSGDGNEEWLSGAFQGSGWVKSNVYNPTGIPFDADFFFEPIVNYNLNAQFVHDPECLFDELGDTVEFFNLATLVDHRMYNRYAFYNQPGAQTWNFGDGSPIVQVTNPAHFYPTNGPFAATVTDRIFSWTQQFCQSSKTLVIDEKPEQGFSFVTDNLDVYFTNETPSSSIFTNIFYDFGDGNTSPSEDPFHKYIEPGTYWVCQTMMTSCGEITECRNVAVATNTALNCGKDSVRYTAARGTEARTMTLKKPQGSQRLIGLGQSFDVPQPMIVHGFSFYANHAGLYRDNFKVECKIWLKGPGNVPDTAVGPLALSHVRINKIDADTNYSNALRYTAIFNQPVNLLKDEDFILTIEYAGDTSVYISTSDWQEGDGDQDLLAVGKVVAGLDTLWVTSATVSLFNAGGLPFDADVHIEPLVEYNFNANFSYDFECLTFDENGQRVVQFTNESSKINQSSIYNSGVFYGSTLDAFDWDFGDSTAISNQVNAQHIFVAPGPFDVKLTINMNGWTNDCQSSQVYNVPVFPTGGFSFEQVTSAVKFIDESHNADEYWWTFSDSTYSSLSDPTHYFLRLGEFEVCQYVSNVCGSDTTCVLITINVIGIPETFMKQMSIYPNPASDYLTIEADLREMETLELSIIDYSGRTVRTNSYKSGIVNGSMYVGDLAQGAYLMEIKAGDYKGTQKLIIAH